MEAKDLSTIQYLHNHLVSISIEFKFRKISLLSINRSLKLATVFFIFLIHLGCSDNIECDDEYCIENVSIEIRNDKIVLSEGNKKIDVNQDGIDDLNIGLGYNRNEIELVSYFFSLKPLRDEIYIAANIYQDTTYNCTTDENSNLSHITIFNTLSPFDCSSPSTLILSEPQEIYYPTAFDSYDSNSSNFFWSNSELILSRCEKRDKSSESTSIVHDFWLNKTAKYIIFELREESTTKGFLKLDTDETGSLHIYEIGLENY